MPDEPTDEKPWELRIKWVVLTAAALWIFGVAALLLYLFGDRGQP